MSTMLGILTIVLVAVVSVNSQINDQIYYPGYFESLQRSTTTTKRYFPTKYRPQSNLNYQNSDRCGNQNSVPKKQRISEQKCEEYSKLAQHTHTGGTLSLFSSFFTFTSDKCDLSQGLIVGGENAKAGEFPHMVAIGYKLRNNQIHYGCGGSLISERFVLTAAHCRILGNIKPSEVRVGDLNLKVRESALPEETIPIESFIYHEKFNGNDRNHDIAVVKLKRNVTFGEYVRPACLMTQNHFNQETATATGWGYTKPIAPVSSDSLQKVDLSVFDTRKCRDIYNDPIFYNLDNSQFCAGELNGGKDTCRGDSGGPLQIISENNTCTYVIIGVTSFGSPECGAKNSPGVFTKVSAYIDWIEKKVWSS